MSPWLSAIRLRTLPLALSSIGMGSFLAASAGYFDWRILLLASLTTIFLQILSNLANDYGDSIHGADSINRLGPKRAVQSGAISAGKMKKAIALFVALSLTAGVLLLLVAFGLNMQIFLFFLFIGLLAIFAAIAYTTGKKPYGYSGYGDISVLIFFGIVGVAGTFYLYTHDIHWPILLPSFSCGCFATAVLNLNNIRDIESDRLAGKKSIPVRLGREKAVLYHFALLIVGFIAAVGYVILQFESLYQFLFLVTLPLFVKNGLAVHRYKTAETLDPYLKQLAISTLIFVVTFGLGLLI